jgi:GTP cyclohydrolase II
MQQSNYRLKGEGNSKIIIDSKDYGIDLGHCDIDISKIRLVSNTKHKEREMNAYGLEITEYVRLLMCLRVLFFK